MLVGRIQAKSTIFFTLAASSASKTARPNLMCDIIGPIIYIQIIRNIKVHQKSPICLMKMRTHMKRQKKAKKRERKLPLQRKLVCTKSSVHVRREKMSLNVKNHASLSFDYLFSSLERLVGMSEPLVFHP